MITALLSITILIGVVVLFLRSRKANTTPSKGGGVNGERIDQLPKE